MRTIALILVLVLTAGGCDLFKGSSNREEVAPLPEAPENLSAIKESGAMRLYYDNGQLKVERTFVNGKLNGPYKFYYENGQLKEEGTYTEDRMNGVFKKYSTEGKLTAEETYANDVLMDRRTF